MTFFMINKVVSRVMGGRDIKVSFFVAPKEKGGSRCLLFQGNTKKVVLVIKHGYTPVKLLKLTQRAIDMIERSGKPMSVGAGTKTQRPGPSRATVSTHPRPGSGVAPGARVFIGKEQGVFPVRGWHFAEQNKDVTKTAILTEEE